MIEDTTLTTLLTFSRVLETTDWEEADELMQFGAKLLAVSARKDETIVYSIGCPEGMKLPDWVP